MLALIERKLNRDDRNVWFRYLEHEKQQASLTKLLEWMTCEMKSRMRAIAPIRADTSQRPTVHHIKETKESIYPFYKCWICQCSNHWVNQCEKLNKMTPSEHLKTVREGHACFSSLKKAGRDHRMATCRRKQKCTEKTNGEHSITLYYIKVM